MTDTAKPQDQINVDQSKTTTSQFIIQRLYVKDSSYEAPGTPQIFRLDWAPEVNLDLQTKADTLEPNTFEVILTLTVTVKLGQATAFLVEVRYAGIFTIASFPAEQMQPILKSYCPSILFPYAREAVTDLVTRGGFPPLYLAPINFDALYEQQMQAQAPQPKNTETQN